MFVPNELKPNEVQILKIVKTDKKVEPVKTQLSSVEKYSTLEILGTNKESEILFRYINEV
jgi:hypothetical protein